MEDRTERMNSVLQGALESVCEQIELLERQADRSADICEDSRAAHHKTIARQRIVHEGITEQIAVLERTKTRLLMTVKQTTKGR